MNEFYLYISSHFFIFPVFLSIYCERYDVLWISTSILCTSLLRWGEPKKIIYQYIDNNWVKLVFLYLFISMFYIFVENTTSIYELVYSCGVLFSIVFYYILHEIFTKISCPLHMYVHFYTVIGLVLMLHVDYDFNQTFSCLQELFFYQTQQITLW